VKGKCILNELIRKGNNSFNRDLACVKILFHKILAGSSYEPAFFNFRSADFRTKKEIELRYMDT